jgi:hypothetical protein
MPLAPLQGGNPEKSPFEGGSRGMLSGLNMVNIYDILNLTK